MTLTLTKEAPAPAEITVREFSHFDRCDRCGFQAYYVLTRERAEVYPGLATENEKTQEIVFCKHHGDKHSPALELAGWSVLDFTEKINEKPSPSASNMDDGWDEDDDDYDY